MRDPAGGGRVLSGHSQPLVMDMRGVMRLALVTAFPPGQRSLNEYGFHLATGLANHPEVEEVVVIADRLDEVRPELEMNNKICVERVWSFNSLTATPRILLALRRLRPDGVLFNLQMTSFGDRELPAGLGLLGPLLARMTGLSSGVIAHNLLAGVDLEQTILQGQPVRQAIARIGASVITRALASASYITTTLPGYVDILRAISPRSSIHHVPHGTFDTENRDLVPFTLRKNTIVTMGKFGTYKRLETTLSAFDLLRQDPRYQDAHLVIGGSDHPNAKGYMQSVIGERKNDRGVSFMGYIPEDAIPAFFERARICLMDYQATTGSSGVMHQAATYGAIPVYPLIGDFIDLYRHEGLTGGHYTPGDACEMSMAISRLLSNPTESDAIARANRNAVMQIPFSEIIDFHVARLRPQAEIKIERKPIRC